METLETRTYSMTDDAQGCDVVFVSRQMGHASVAVTLSVYAKEFDGRRHGIEATRRLEAVWADALG